MWMGWVCGLGKKKKKDKFISGEAGVINAGVCWLIDLVPVAVLHVRHSSGCSATAKEIWVKAATSPRLFWDPKEWLCPLA